MTDIGDYTVIDVAGEYSSADQWHVFEDAGFLTSTDIMTDTDAAAELAASDTPNKLLSPPGAGTAVTDVANAVLVSEEGMVRFPDGLRVILAADYDGNADPAQVYASAEVPTVA